MRSSFALPLGFAVAASTILAPLHAQDALTEVQCYGPPGGKAVTRACAPGPSNVLFPPPECDDFIFIVNQGPDLDTNCVFERDRPQGLHIDLPVDRYFGDPAKLRANGLLGYYAELSMAVYDVDSSGEPNDPEGNPEVDTVSINGQLLKGKALRGLTDKWQLNTFSVPSSLIRFPDDPEDGVMVPALNHLVIKIDTANPAKNYWCTSIDWVALRIRAVRPVVFVHGIFSSGQTFTSWRGDPHRATGLQWHYGLAADNSLSMGPLDSIQSNSGRIGGKLGELKTKWNFEKLNIVAHSKGGLDSRYYVASHKDVDSLVMVGTPNRGSRLAEASITVLGVLFPQFTALTLFAKPAGYQLTVTYVNLWFNPFTRRNSAVSYSTIAGAYESDCSGVDCLVDLYNYGLTLSGRPGDTVVPERSVHWSGLQGLEQTHHSSGPNHSATHFGINKDSGVLNDLVVPILRTSIKSRDKVAAAEKAEYKGGSTLSASSMIGEQSGLLNLGSSRSFTFALSENTPTVFRLYTSNQDNVGIELTAPNGAVINSAAPPAGYAFSSEEFLDMRSKLFGVGSPAAGNWTVRLSAIGTTASGRAELPFQLAVEAPQSVYTLEAAIVDAPILAGTNVPVEARMLSGATVVTSGLALTGLLRAGSGAETALTFRDDGAAPDLTAGDGVFTANVPLQPGEFSVGVTALLSANGGTVRRLHELPLIVPEAGPTVPVQWTVATVDSDGDSLINDLNLTATLGGSVEGKIVAVATLENSAGGIWTQGVEASIAGTNRQLLFSFPGKEIAASFVNGPYSLKSLDLALVDDEAAVPTPLKATFSPFSTEAFGFRQFQRQAVEFFDGATSEGIDSNGDGLYESLVVRVPVDCIAADGYEWTGVIRDAAGTLLGYTGGSGSLAVGPGSCEFTFGGEVLGASGFVPPLCLDDIAIASRTLSAVRDEEIALGNFGPRDFSGCDAQCQIQSALLAREGGLAPSDINSDGVIDSADLLLANRLAGGGADPLEPDGIYLDARPVAVNGASVTRAISPADDADWFRFTLTTPSTLTVRTASATNADTYLAIYNSEMTPLASNDDYNAAGLSQVILSPAVTGDYFARVTCSGRASTLPSYSLQVSATPIGFENLPIDGTRVPGSIAAAERRFYQFKLDTIAALSVGTEGPTGDTYLVVYDARFNAVASNDDSGPGAFSLINFIFVAPGVYYAEVRGYNTAAVIPEYSIFASAQPFPIRGKLEATGTTATSSIEVGEREFYELFVREPSRVQIETSGSQGDTVLVLYTSGGNIAYSNDDGGQGSFSLITTNVLQPDRYYVEVRSYNSQQAIAEYTLTTRPVE